MLTICFVIAEILLFIAGIWAVITGKVPALVFGKKYRIEGWGARIIGLIIALPMATLMLGVVVSLLVSEEAGAIAGGISIFVLIGSLIVALVVSRIVRQPA